MYSIRSAGLALLALGLPGLAAASPLAPRFEFEAGVACAFVDSKIRVDAPDGTSGTEIDGEDGLGLETPALAPRFAIRWRPDARLEFEAVYEVLARSAMHRAKGDFEFADTTFTEGYNIQADARSDVARLGARYALWTGPREQAGAKLGLGVRNVDINLLQIGVPFKSLSERLPESRSMSVPFVTVGVFGRMERGESWAFTADAHYIGAPFGRDNGSGFGATLEARRWFAKAIACTFAYDLTLASVDIAPDASGSHAIDSGRLRDSVQGLRLSFVLGE